MTVATFAGGGEVVTWGQGVPSRTSWGDPIPVVDPGIPLSLVGGTGPHDPLGIWRTQPSVRKVIEFTARNVASVPLHGYARVSDTDRRRLSGSVLEEAFSHPRRGVSGYRLLYDLTVDMCIYDMWCVALIDGSLQRIPPRLLDIHSDFLGNLGSIRVNAPNGYVSLDEVPVAYDAGWHPANASGVSPMTTLAALINEQTRAVQWRDAQWDQSAKMVGVLTYPRVMQEGRRERFLRVWGEFRRSKAGGTPLLEDGLEYKPIETLKPVDAKDIEGRELTDAEVASAFHIPPELVGARAGTFSNIDAFRQMLFGPTLGPIMTSFEQAFNAEIVPTLGGAGAYIEFNRESALSGGFKEQADVMSRAVGGPWLTRAEARAKQNLPHIDGTEELIVPMNVTEGGLASPADTAPEGEGL